MKKIRKKHAEQGKKRRQGSCQLLPKNEPQERLATLQEIEDCIANSPSPKFVEYAAKFRDAFRAGDVIVEFCSDKASWRTGLGMAGYVLRRNSVDMARLICAMS